MFGAAAAANCTQYQASEGTNQKNIPLENTTQ